MEYTPAEIVVGMDDETNRLIDAPDVRKEHSVERINLRKRRFGLKDRTQWRQLAHTYVFKMQEVTSRAYARIRT